MDDIDELAKVWQTACEKEIEQLKAENAKLKADIKELVAALDAAIEDRDYFHDLLGFYEN